MIIFLISIIILCSAWDTWKLLERKQIKQMIVSISLYILALTFGLFYLSNPYRTSLALILLQAFHLPH